MKRRSIWSSRRLRAWPSIERPHLLPIAVPSPRSNKDGKPHRGRCGWTDSPASWRARFSHRIGPVRHGVDRALMRGYLTPERHNPPRRAGADVPASANPRRADEARRGRHRMADRSHPGSGANLQLDPTRTASDHRQPRATFELRRPAPRPTPSTRVAAASTGLAPALRASAATSISRSRCSYRPAMNPGTMPSRGFARDRPTRSASPPTAVATPDVAGSRGGQPTPTQSSCFIDSPGSS